MQIAAAHGSATVFNQTSSCPVSSAASKNRNDVSRSSASQENVRRMDRSCCHGICSKPGQIKTISGAGRTVIARCDTFARASQFVPLGNI